VALEDNIKNTIRNMAVYIKVSKDDVTLEEVKQVFENPTDKFDIHNFDGTKGDYYEMEVRGFEEGEERKAQKELLKIVDNLRKQNLQINIGQQFYSKDYDETLEVYSIREQTDPKIYLRGTDFDREVTLYKSDIVKLLNEERLKAVETPKKTLNTSLLNGFIGDLAWGNNTEMDRLKQVYLSFSPKEREFVEKNAVKEGANSIEEVFEKALSKDEKEKLENKINNFFNTVKQMETTEQKEINQQPAIDLQVGQKLHYKEDVFEVARFAKNQNGQDMVILKDPSIGTGVEIPWYRSKLEEVINSGQYNLTKPNKIEQQQNQNQEQKPQGKEIDVRSIEINIGQKFQSTENNHTFEIVGIGKEKSWDNSDTLLLNSSNGLKEISKLQMQYAVLEGRVRDITSPERELSEQQFTQLNYLKNQVKYLGLGEDSKLHKDLENAILSPEAKVTVRAEYNHPDRLMKGNTATFDLNINKTEQGGVFLNSYRANLTTKNGEERSQTFKVQKENSITAKEAINLLEGRSVKMEHDVVDKETGELSRTESFIKLNMKETKTDYGNYKYEWYNQKAYGVDVDNIMQKSNLAFADDTERERTKKHLEKGNITQVTFLHENRQVQGFAVLNPQWKMLNLYDSAMNRVTTQNQLVKPEVTQSQQKNNVPEHSISR